jgi:hypothetical protein
MYHAQEERRLNLLFLEKIEEIFGVMNFMDARYDEGSGEVDVTLAHQLDPTQEQLDLVWGMGVKCMFLKTYGRRETRYFYVTGPREGKVING